MGCTESKPPDESTATKEMAKLAEMYQRGLLDEQEFAAGKAKLLGLPSPYQDDKKTVETMGCVKLGSPVQVEAGKALSAAVFLHYCEKPENDDMWILHLGNGWSDHFSIGHQGGKLRFQASAASAQGVLEGCQQVQSKLELQAGQTYFIVAVLLPDGRQRLYIDGRLEAEGPGLSALDDFKPAVEATSREQGWLGRWMRPDKSAALPAGLLCLQLYGDELTEQHQLELLNRVAKERGQSLAAGGADPPLTLPAITDQALRKEH